MLYNTEMTPRWLRYIVSVKGMKKKCILVIITRIKIMYDLNFEVLDWGCTR